MGAEYIPKLDAASGSDAVRTRGRPDYAEDEDGGEGDGGIPVMEYGLLAIIGILLIERAIQHCLVARERKELYNRLQAGTLTDYVRNQIVTDSAKKPISTQNTQEFDERERNIPVVAVDEVAIAESQDAFTRLMGESGGKESSAGSID